MAYITKRGSSYSVRYTYQDEHGKSCDSRMGHADPEIKAKLRLALLT